MFKSWQGSTLSSLPFRCLNSSPFPFSRAAPRLRAAESRFGGCSIGSDGIALEVTLEKTA